ncbi:MAG: capsule assembly Wzi family protein, partial [Candidatus Eisenbacteria bacterium]
RLLWTLTPDLALGLSEGARYQADAPGVLYLTGILPYTLVERLQMQDEPSDSTENYLRNNVLWSVDVSWRVRAGLLLYAEFLADDIATQSSAMPTRGGVQFGLAYAPRWRGWDWTLGAEYTRVSDYTYSVYYQDLCRCDWEHQGQPLGYALGPDAELMLLRAGLAPTRRLSFSTWVQHLRRGDGAIGRPWRPAEADCACDDADAWSFDDPAQAWTVGCEARYRPGALIWAGAAVEHVARHHAGDAGESEDWTSETRLRLMLSAGM